MYHFGEIVLLAFPYTDHTTIKKRPALVLLDTEDGDVLVARVTTQSYPSPYEIAVSDWEAAGLLAPSFVKVNKLATLKASLIEKKLGKLSEADLAKVAAISTVLLVRI
ncbi:MAG TPA: type II toxin-antitoxin system PemK/MazF family toxin [Saprospiraceae bacterium]|nr:type II toxin-antitoxin system PemK/MazF family toxin [Saprospiraceae bacterium]